MEMARGIFEGALCDVGMMFQSTRLRSCAAFRKTPVTHGAGEGRGVCTTTQVYMIFCPLRWERQRGVDAETSPQALRPLPVFPWVLASSSRPEANGEATMCHAKRFKQKDANICPVHHVPGIGPMNE